MIPTESLRNNCFHCTFHFLFQSGQIYTRSIHLCTPESNTSGAVTPRNWVCTITITCNSIRRSFPLPKIRPVQLCRGEKRPLVGEGCLRNLNITPLTRKICKVAQCTRYACASVRVSSQR